MKRILGDKREKEYYIPAIDNMVRCFRGETLFLFGLDSVFTKYRWVYGVGRVCKIMQGENVDLVYINFGRKYPREIMVQYNHARRQLLTLKRGQLATFYGKFRIFTENKKLRYAFYAIGLQAWYVPKSMDIKKLDLETYEKIQGEEEKTMINLIDELLK